LNDLTVSQAAEGLRKKKYSSLELTKAYLERIGKINPDLNAYVSVTKEAALKSKDILLERQSKYNIGNSYFRESERQRDSDLQKSLEALESWCRAIVDSLCALRKNPSNHLIYRTIPDTKCTGGCKL